MTGSFKHKTQILAKTCQSLRAFFDQQDFVEIHAPPMVQNPGMEPHIHPFLVKGLNPFTKTQYYLHSSPEFYMKQALSEGLDRLYTLGFSFRDEPKSPEHRKQFLMLEWYRSDVDYLNLIDDCVALVKHLKKSLALPQLSDSNITTLSIQNIFLKYAKLDILQFNHKDDLYKQIKNNFSSIPLPAYEQCGYDDLFFLIFLNIIEPELKKYQLLFLTDYPADLCALAEINKDNPLTCKRFEMYYNGAEIANCFQELINLENQKNRFVKFNVEKKKLYHYSLPEPKVLFNALEKGLPRSSGIALGVERLAQRLLNEQDLFSSVH